MNLISTNAPDPSVSGSISVSDDDHEQNLGTDMDDIACPHEQNLGIDIVNIAYPEDLNVPNPHVSGNVLENPE